MLGAGSTWRRLVVAAVVVFALVLAMTSPWRGRSVPVAAAADGISLLPAAGQFTPLPGTPVLDSRNGTGLSSPNLAPGSTLTFSVTTVGGTATGVPANTSAVVLEYNTQANFAGVLSTGVAAGATDTSLTFPANVERNGFDIVMPAANGTAALAITGFSPIPTGAVLSKLVVRLHGYYSGSSTATAGSTYVGYDPALLASSSNSPSGFTLNGTGTSGPLSIGSGSYTVQVAGNAGVPNDGSATAVALQTIVQDPACSGGFSLTPAGSGRSDYDGSFTSGQEDENFDLIALPSSGQLSLQLLGCTGTATVTIRVRGYYSAPTATTPGSSYVPAQRKVFDTTSGTGTSSCPMTADAPKLAAHSGCTIQVLGTGSFPSSGVSGLAAQVVAVNPGHDGWLGLYSSASVAHTATLWYSPTGRTSNFEVASYTDVNPDGTVYVWNGGDYPVDVVIRAHGYYRAPTAPSTAPQSLVVQADPDHPSASVAVTLTPPATPADGGAAITGWQVTATPTDNAAVGPLSTTVPIGTMTGSLDGLAPSTSYAFSAAMLNAVSSGPPSPSVSYRMADQAEVTFTSPVSLTSAVSAVQGNGGQVGEMVASFAASDLGTTTDLSVGAYLGAADQSSLASAFAAKVQQILAGQAKALHDGAGTNLSAAASSYGLADDPSSGTTWSSTDQATAQQDTDDFKANSQPSDAGQAVTAAGSLPITVSGVLIEGDLTDTSAQLAALGGQVTRSTDPFPEPTLTAQTTCGTAWLPTYHPTPWSNYADSEGWDAYVYQEFGWGPRALNTLKCYGPNVTWEEDFVTNNADGRHFFSVKTDRYVGWDSNLPLAYGDTAFDDGTTYPTYTVGSADATRLHAYTHYWTYYETWHGNWYSDTAKVNGQRGHRVNSWCSLGWTWCVFASRTKPILPAWTVSVPFPIYGPV
ncbi:MAG: fibronectin type III domain-containing protein [Frankiaceae bacterium]